MLLFAIGSIWAVGLLTTLGSGLSGWGAPAAMWALGLGCLVRVHAIDRRFAGSADLALHARIGSRTA